MTVPPLRRYAMRFEVGDADLPEDRDSDHVTNPRYFLFVTRTLTAWSREMGIRGRIRDFAFVMAHIEYDFLREVKPPGVVECRLEVLQVGRTSLVHGIEMADLGPDGSGPGQLAGRGRARQVWFDRRDGRPAPWPAELLARCWDGGPVPPPEPPAR